MLELSQDTLDKFFYDAFTKQEVTVQDLVDFTKKYSLQSTVVVNKLILEAVDAKVEKKQTRATSNSGNKISYKKDMIFAFLSNQPNRMASRKEIMIHLNDNGESINYNQMVYIKEQSKDKIESTGRGPGSKWMLKR